MSVLLIQILSFCAVLLFVFGINSAIRGQRTVEKTGAQLGVFGWFGSEISVFGKMLNSYLVRIFPQENLRMQKNLLAAALDDQIYVHDIRGLQGLLGLATAGVVFVFILVASLNGAGAVLGGLFGGAVGYYAPLVWLQGVAQRRKEAISKDLPFAIDLLTVAMEAGQDFGAAVRYLVKEMSPSPLRQEFNIMLRENDFGKSRIEALRSMAGRVQIDEFQSVVTSVAQSTEMGASVAFALKLQAEEIRRARFHRAERKAARAPSLMLIPVALFILPAVFIIILTPVIMRMMDTLPSMR